MIPKNITGPPFQIRRFFLLCFTLVLIATAAYAIHPAASQSNSNPWVSFPIYQTRSSDDVVIDWPLVAWTVWPGYPLTGKVMIKNLETGVIQDLSDDLPCQPYGDGRGALALHGDWLVGSFACNYPQPSEIHALNLITRELIVLEPLPGLPPEQQWANEPAIYGQNIVWQQEDVFVGRSDLFLFNLQSRTVISLTQTSTILEAHPEIYGDWMTWNRVNWASGDNSVAIYNLSSGEQISIPLIPSYETWVYLDNQFVAWTDWRNGNADVYGFDLISRQEFPLIVKPNHQGILALRDGILVYHDQTNPVSLYVHEISTQETQLLFSVQPQQGFSHRVRVDNGTVAWIKIALLPTQTTVYGAKRFPERFFLPILPQP